jgi:NAD+ synthase (glutamine-hydrolysing)
MDFTAAAVQFAPVIGDVRKNIDKHIDYIEKAINSDVKLIVFPELSLTGYTLMDLAMDVALKADSPILNPLKELSEKISIFVGGVELSTEYFIYNVSFFFEEGSLKYVTRKAYPPTYGVFQEKRFFAQGKHIAAFDSRLGRMGVMICNDARHPALAYILAMDGAKILITQSATPARGFPQSDKPASVKNFEIGNRFYSAVFGVYTIFSDLAGYEDGLLFSGDSLIAAPGGNVIAEAPLFEEAMITAVISEDEIRRYRALNPLLAEENIDIPLDELARIKRRQIEG